MSLGWPFLNHFVIHFDVAQRYLGFATSTACWPNAGAASGSGTATAAARGWDGAGSSGALVLGGLPGPCGTGTTTSFSNADCVPRSTFNSSATSCDAIILSSKEVQQGWELGSCGAPIPEGQSCQLACAPGFTAEFSTAFWCGRRNDTQSSGTPGEPRLALSQGTQLCIPLAWEPLDPALVPGSSLPWTVQSDHPVKLNWSLPAIPFPLRVDLVWVASDSASAGASPPPLLLAPPTRFSSTPGSWSAGPTLSFRAPNVTSASVFRVQAFVTEGRPGPAGATLLFRVLPRPPPTPTPATPTHESSTAVADSAASTGVAPLSSTAAAVVASSTAIASSSSTGSSFDPHLEAASVFLDTSLLYSEVIKDVSGFLASLLEELTTVVPRSRIADLHVEAHTDPTSSAALAAAEPSSEAHARFSFVIRPPTASAPQTEPTVPALVDALRASFPNPTAKGLISSKITRVQSTMVAACEDGGYRVDCASAEQGVAKGPQPASSVDRTWIYVVLALAATMAAVLCWCILRRARASHSGDGSGDGVGEGHVRVTTSLPTTNRSKTKSKPKSKPKGKGGRASAPAVRKHEGERFTIVDTGDDEDLDAFEDEEEEMEMEELPTEDRTSLDNIGAVSIAVHEPEAEPAQPPLQQPRPPSPSRTVRSPTSPSGYVGAPSRIAPPPAAIPHDDLPDFEMDAASDDEDELNQL